MAEEFRRIKREHVYKGAIIDVYQDHVEIPNGNVAKWDYIHHKGAAAVVPVRADGKLLMVRQYRNALDRYTLEIPAGGLDEVDEPTLHCAARELEEETGYKSQDLELLITVRTTVAFCNEKIDIYVAHNLEQSQQHLDEDEFVDVVVCTVDELVAKIYCGEIEDAKTVAAILAYQNKFGGGNGGSVR